MSASLLDQMSSGVLSGVPRSAVMGLSDSVKQRLALRVRGQFGDFSPRPNASIAAAGRPGYGG